MDPREFEQVVDDALTEVPQWVIERSVNLRMVAEKRPVPTRAQNTAT